MKTIITLLLLSFSVFAATKTQPEQPVPPLMLTAKNMALWVYWPGAADPDRYEVQLEGEHFLKSWKRYNIVQDLKDAEVLAIVIVRPLTVEPGFWQRWAAIRMASGSSNCYRAGDGVSCSYTAPNQALANQLMLPSTVLGGSILVYDAADIRKDMIAGKHFMEGDAQPIMAAFSDGKGSRPLIGAGKQLRKEIDKAAATH